MNPQLSGYLSTKERKHSNDIRAEIPRVRKKVNDVISAVFGTGAERLLSHLNSVEPSIQFTL